MVQCFVGEIDSDRPCVATWRSVTHKCDSQSLKIKKQVQLYWTVEIFTAEVTSETCLENTCP